MSKLLFILSFVMSFTCLTSHSWALQNCPSSPPFYNCYGSYTFTDGNTYVGEWQNNKYNGQGTFIFKSRDKYEGGGVVAIIEVLADTIQKNKQAKEEQRKQEIEIAQANKLLAQKRLLNPPNINWVSGWNLRYQGTINRHNQKSGVNFAFTQNLSQ